MAEMKTNVLIAVDGSSDCESAISYYMAHLHKPGNHIILSHVIELPEISHARESYISPGILNESWKEEIEKSKATENKYKEVMKEHGIDDVRVRLEGGMKPGQIICRVAEEEQASLVVVGTRGMGKLRRTIMGSVSDFLVHHAHCPVVVCRH